MSVTCTAHKAEINFIIQGGKSEWASFVWNFSIQQNMPCKGFEVNHGSFDFSTRYITTEKNFVLTFYFVIVFYLKKGLYFDIMLGRASLPSSVILSTYYYIYL